MNKFFKVFLIGILLAFCCITSSWSIEIKPGSRGKINLTINNTGTHTIDGLKVGMLDKPLAIFSITPISSIPKSILPGQSGIVTFGVIASPYIEQNYAGKIKFRSSASNGELNPYDNYTDEIRIVQPNSAYSVTLEGSGNGIDGGEKSNTKHKFVYNNSGVLISVREQWVIFDVSYGVAFDNIPTPVVTAKKYYSGLEIIEQRDDGFKARCYVLKNIYSIAGERAMDWFPNNPGEVVFNWSVTGTISPLSIRGSISGKATIVETGQTVKGVKIEILQQNTVKRSVVTDNSGIYRVEKLPSGSYDIRASINGISQTKKE